MDFMHIVKVHMSGHLLPLLKGQRDLVHPIVKANLEKDRDISRFLPACLHCHPAAL